MLIIQIIGMFFEALGSVLFIALGVFALAAFAYTMWLATEEKL